MRKRGHGEAETEHRNDEERLLKGRKERKTKDLTIEQEVTFMKKNGGTE